MKDTKQTEYQRQLIKILPVLKAFTLVKVRNYHDAQDILQNTLIKLSSTETKFDRKKGTFKTFAFTICRREIINFFREVGRSPLVFMEDLPEYGSSRDNLDLSQLEMDTIFQLLDPKKQAFILQYHFGNMEKTSTERNRAMRILREVAAKLAHLDPEAFHP